MKKNLTMNLNNKIGFLLDTGFTPEFVSKLNENKINLLFEKMSKKEILEAITMVSKDDASTQQKLKTSKQPFQIYEKELEEDEFYTDISGIDQDPIQKSSPDYPGSDRGTTSSLDEKFESKAQQGLFWARCNKCKTDDCKWCKMAKEFSKSTSKKQYKDMPEKKHPEKVVKYKKKETKEDFGMGNYFEKVASVAANNLKSGMLRHSPMQYFSENKLEKIIQDNLSPKITKRDLLILINQNTYKK